MRRISALAALLSLVLLPWLAATARSADTAPATRPAATQPATAPAAPYDTAVGPLRPAQLKVMSGANVQFRGDGPLHIVDGFAEVPAGEALPVNDIFPWHNFPRVPPRGVTLVQDRATGRWLATDGVVAIANAQFVLVDGQDVRIVGGPFKIRDAAFTDQTIVLRDAQPTVVAAAPAPTGQAGGGDASGSNGTVYWIAGAAAAIVALGAVAVIRRRRRGMNA